MFSPRMLRMALVLLSCAAYASAQPTVEPATQPRWMPDSLQLVGDVPYAATDNPRQRLDLVVPRAEADGPRPVVVFIHGGAWRAGDKRSGLRRLGKFAKTNHYAIASIGYRLTDEAQWPAQIHDCKAAIRWLRANASKYQLDADRIGVWGSSAGGHLVAVLGTSGDVPEMDGTLGPHTDVSSRVACVVDFFGPTDFLQMNRTAAPGARLDHDSARAPEALLIGGPIQQNKAKAATANPITYVSDDDSPFFIVHGTDDKLVPHNQSQLLVEALRQSSVPCSLLTIRGGGHGRGFPDEVGELVGQFFDHHLRGVETTWQDQSLPATSR